LAGRAPAWFGDGKSASAQRLALSALSWTCGADFARAMRAPTRLPQIYISGTAAIIGHVSHHAGDSAAQLAETLTNLDSLLASARIDAGARFGPRSTWKIYLRHADDATLVRALLRDRLGANTPMLLLQGDICRAELLVEIDGLQSA